MAGSGSFGVEDQSRPSTIAFSFIALKRFMPAFFLLNEGEKEVSKPSRMMDWLSENKFCVRTHLHHLFNICVGKISGSPNVLLW